MTLTPLSPRILIGSNIYIHPSYTDWLQYRNAMGKTWVLGDFISFAEYHRIFCPLPMYLSPKPGACNKKYHLIQEHSASHIIIQ